MLVFVLAFVMRLPQDRTIVATAMAAGTVFGGFIRSLGKRKNFSKGD
jgi:hypothetical protein